ncbi:MAG: hypothetical protein J6040_05490 [Clostridiales bacterium]|nr:hypothetical protein [Clostridiales bacterium]MBQ5966191.1 hypothetical protein [Clostridiales bacterium]MCR5057969.1 hypothetical protein [Clostridiales bacterium]
MKNRTAIAIVIMVACFAMSMVFLFISAGFYMISGTKELADRIRDNRWDDLPPKIEFITVDDDSVVVDLPGLDVLVDDAGVDVNVFGIHVDLRDEDDIEAKEKKEKEESKEKKSESKKDGKDEKKDKKKGDAKKG